MASELSGGRGGLARLKTTLAGAILQNASFTFDPASDPAYRAYLGNGLDAVQITSPIAAAGAADLEIRSGATVFFLAGGGNVQAIPGPINNLTITARNAAVAGSGADDVRITPLSRLKTGNL